MPNRCRTAFLLVVAATFAVGLLSGARAANGPYEVTTGSYQFLDRSEPRVATDRKVDLWAEVYRPSKVRGKTFPLVVFLHGNHGTCGRFDQDLRVRSDDRSDYTDTGKCPPGYLVTPNHLGYAYLADELASWGYVVVSINANRGITAGDGLPEDRGLNLMRGRLILRHLQLLSDWNRGVGSIPPPASLRVDPKGIMDFSQVGLMGHSRGGEGARAALQQYRDEGSPFPALIGPMTIRSIFEIGPVDGQTSRVLNADGVNSIILLPSCDGDVSNLQGMKVFDRTFIRTKSLDPVAAFHGTVTVWGANHNAYNTEWLTSDSPGCFGADQIFPAAGRSKTQQITAAETLVPFFRATVGADADRSLAALFEPNGPVPADIDQLTKIDRGYLAGPLGPKTVVLERFAGATGMSDRKVPTTKAGVSVTHQAASDEHNPGTRVATVSWDENSPAVRYFQLNLAPDAGVGFAAYKSLSFRTALRCFFTICRRLPAEDGEMDFTVSLIDAAGQMSNAYRVNGPTRLSRPVGPAFLFDPENDDAALHSTLYTAQIPFTAFRGVDMVHIKAVRFTFQQKPRGVVDIGTLTLSKDDPVSEEVTTAAAARTQTASAATASALPKQTVATPTAGADGNTMKIVRGSAARRTAGSSAAAGRAPGVDIVLTSKRSFPVTGAFPKLKVGDSVVEGGVVSADGKTMTVSVPEATFDDLPSGGDVSLFVQASSPVWRFGALLK